MLAGFALGLVVAVCYYRMCYVSPLSQHAGSLTAAVHAASGSRYALAGAGDGDLELLPPTHGTEQV